MVSIRFTLRTVGALILAGGLVAFQGCTSTENDDPKCPGDTTTLVVNLTVPSGLVGAAVTITGPGSYSATVTSTDTLSGLAAGSYTVTYKRLKVAGTVVGKAYYGKISEPAFTLAACTPNTISVEYVQEPGSERAYVLEGSAIRAFTAAQLAVTGSPEAATSLKSPAGPKGIAFDAWGNLWFSNAEGVFMYAMEDLAKADAVYRVKLTGEGVMGRALPGAGPLAFDDEGNLWVGQIASDRAVKLPKASLAATGKPTPTVTLSGASLNGVQALAFDADGNLWAANADDAVVRFGKARLAADGSGAADVVIVHRSGPPVIGTYSTPSSLAFDAAGNLWIGFFAGNDLVKVPKAALAASDTIQPPAVALKGSVLALIEGLAFDEAGGAWMPGKAGQVVKAGAGKLAASGDLALDVIITSPQIGYADEIAFNPAPEALPLRD